MPSRWSIAAAASPAGPAPTTTASWRSIARLLIPCRPGLHGGGPGTEARGPPLLVRLRELLRDRLEQSYEVAFGVGEQADDDALRHLLGADRKSTRLNS